MRALIERRRELAKQLELSDEQRQRIEAIRDRQQRMGIEQRAKMNIARLDLRTLLRAERLDRQALEAKVDDISRIEAQLRKARLDMLLDMRNVLTPEQQKKLRALRGATGGEI
jgi:Spy/CpxP family protein refolding chaperone